MCGEVRPHASKPSQADVVSAVCIIHFAPDDHDGLTDMVAFGQQRHGGAGHAFHERQRGLDAKTAVAEVADGIARGAGHVAMPGDDEFRRIRHARAGAAIIANIRGVCVSVELPACDIIMQHGRRVIHRQELRDESVGMFEGPEQCVPLIHLFHVE